MNVLSIDWSYFMKVSDEERLSFPEADTPSALSLLKWARLYSSTPELQKKGIKSKEVDILKRIIDKQQPFYLAIADSHAHLGQFFASEELSKIIKDSEESIQVVNIDSSMNRGDWVTTTLEHFPRAEVTWVCDKADTEIPGYVVVSNSLDVVAKCSYNMIYLCRSSNSSMPHLDKEFSALCRFLAKRCNGVILREELPGRWDSEFQKDIKTANSTAD